MWGYYAKNGNYQGYNLGFDEKSLKNAFESELKDGNYPLCDNIIYKLDKQAGLIYEKMKELIDNYPDEDKCDYNKSDWVKHALGSELWNFIAEKKMFFKASGFATENEYRFVLKISDDIINDSDTILPFKKHFRVGSSGIITPYIEWKFENTVPFSEITLAPMMEIDSAKTSLSDFLNSNGYKNVDIITSSIQLRF